MPANFEHFKVFYYVAKLGSVTLAAQEMSLTQPSVTRAIHTLEDQLNCRLFVRSKKGMTLSTEGEMVYQRIFAGCDLFFSAEEELEQMNLGNTGMVRIGTDDLDMRRDYVLEVIQKYQEKYPLVKFKIVQKDGMELTKALETGELDLCVLANDSSTEDGANEVTALHSALDAKLICEYQDVVVVGEKYAHLAKNPITLAELNQYPLILWESGTASHKFFERMYRRRGLTMEPTIELASIELEILMVQRGMGYCFAPLHCVEEQLKAGMLFALNVSDCPLMRQFHLLVSKTRPLSFAARKFVDMIDPEYAHLI